MKSFLIATALFFATVLLASSLCRADGFIVIHNPPQRTVPGHFSFAPLEVTYHHVSVDINDQVATTVEQEFYNPNGVGRQNHRNHQRRETELRHRRQFRRRRHNQCIYPALWATRRVGFLLDQIRMHGESKELKDEVTRLAREQGIVTPYTAYLILEDEKSRNVPLTLQSLRELGSDDRARRESEDRFQQAAQEAAAPAARTGEKAVEAARDVNGLKDSENLGQLAQNAQGGLDKSASTASVAGLRAGGGAADANGPVATFGVPSNGYRAAHNYAQQARVINGRAFYQNGNTWTDSTAQTRKNLKEKKIAFGSDDYFALLKNHPEAAQWLSLGNEVDVVLDDTLYVVR